MKYPQLVSMPSAVSDWLEEQLEARGIDAVVYTRYVLSLLYRDPVDIICPDQELHVAQPQKEVRRAGGGGGNRKRLCRSSNSHYWEHADADQLKRSAAVECLKSAADEEKGGIESLVDELCVKLKEVQQSSEPVAPSSLGRPAAPRKHHSERESAKRYYAAFPALTQRPNAPSTPPPKFIQLIPKWFSTPKRRAVARRHPCRSVGAQPPSSRYNHFHPGSHRHIASGCPPPPTTRSASRKSRNLMEIYSESKEAAAKHQVPSNTTAVGDALDDESMDAYDVLPLNISNLLASPSPPRASTARDDFMNLANMRDTGSKKFLQCGTNIISSIWTTHTQTPADHNNYYDSKFMRPPSCRRRLFDDAPTSTSVSSSGLDHKFSNISIDRGLWPEPVLPIANTSFLDMTWGCKLEKWSDGFEMDACVNRSLMKINHNHGGSAFAVFRPRALRFDGFTKQLKPIAGRVAPPTAIEAGVKEDLLYSTKSHFRPINEQNELMCPQHEYADGTTFAIPGHLDTVNFRRSDSGIMYLDEPGSPKRYLEYKPGALDNFVLKFHINQNDKACQTDPLDTLVDTHDEEVYFPRDVALLSPLSTKRSLFSASTTSGDAFITSDYGTYSEELPSLERNVEDRANSVMADLFRAGSSGRAAKCEQCDSGAWNTTPLPAPIGWNKNASAENIWTGAVCMQCLRRSNDPSDDGFQPAHERQQLREDIKEDGEQLLSDLSSLQHYYLEEGGHGEDLPMAAEESFDLDAIMKSAKDNGNRTTTKQPGANETKAEEGTDDMQLSNEWNEFRIKHGGVPIHSASFSFATRLQQDCLLKMATIPTLRSVTL